MKTLHLTNCWHAESGGISTFYRELLRQAEAEGRQIRLVVPAEEDRVEERGNCVRIYHVRSRPSPMSPGYRMIMPGSYLFKGGRLRQILSSERPDVVEICDKYTLNYLGGLLRRGWLGLPDYRPAVVGLTCERMDDNMACYLSARGAARRFCQWYMQWLYFPLFDHHIAVSPRTADELREVSFGHHKRRGVWMRPMGADCRLFSPVRRTEEFRRWLHAHSGAPEGATLLFYAGRLAPEKNLSLLLDTMRDLERHHAGEFHLLFAGDGPLRSDLEQTCSRDLPGATHFLGYVRDRERLADIYANCDALMHPNPREPFGIAPLEAMASGLPLIAPDSGGVTIYANAKNAFLVKPEAKPFAAAAVALRHDSGRSGPMRGAARTTAESYDWPTVAASFFALYEELHEEVRGACEEPATPPAFYSTSAV